MRRDLKTITYDRDFDLNIPGIHLRYSISKSNKKLASDSLRNSRILKVDFDENNDRISTLGMELTEIAAFLFSIENFHQENFKLKRAVFSSRNPEFWNNLRKDFESIFEFLTRNRISLEFKSFPSEYKKRIEKCNPIKKYDACSLFSDGIDSFITFLEARKHGRIFGVAIAHNSRIKRNIDKIKGLIPNAKIYLFNLLRRTPIRAKSSLQQTRGFMYLCVAATYSEIHKTNKIIVGECGPVMYQPRFLPSDDVTRTTNLAMLRASERLFSDVFDTKFKILTPFENNTKAEMISLLPNEIKKNKMNYFSSCLRSTYTRKKNCGKCYSCLLRKLSSVVAGATDMEFDSDILIYDSSSIKDLKDLIPFLQFCKNVLNDFSGIDREIRYVIEDAGKENLFRRYSLDVMSGLYLLYIKNKRGNNRFASNFIKDSLKDGTITKDEIEERINAIRNHDFPKPNFQ